MDFLSTCLGYRISRVLGTRILRWSARSFPINAARTGRWATGMWR